MASKKFLSNLDSFETPAIIQKVALQAESEKCFQIWFFPRFRGKKWRRSEHAHASYPGLFFSTARVQPLYGAGREESSGTGLHESK